MMTGSSSAGIPIFFSDAYLQSLNADHVVKFTPADKVLGVFYRFKNCLISLKYSPFGGIWMPQATSQSDFSRQFSFFEDQQRKNGVEKIVITTPPEYYQDFVSSKWFVGEGFEKQVAETNQFFDLTTEIGMHKMEVRKLKSLDADNWKLNPVPLSDFQKLHHFLSVCRSQQQLEINIDWPRLSRLTSLLPGAYEGWVLTKNDEWTAAVIMVKVTDSIVYYYLPGTDQKFKNASPMVRLLNDLFHIYQKQGFHVMDLGISSVEGQMQEGLYQFKKHMGAKSCNRNTYQKSLIR